MLYIDSSGISFVNTKLLCAGIAALVSMPGSAGASIVGLERLFRPTLQILPMKRLTRLRSSRLAR